MFKILSIILTLLLSLNLSLEFILPDSNQDIKSEINNDELKDIFLSSIKNHGLSDELVQEVSDNKSLFYKVKVYSDLPFDLLLLELERNFSDKNVTIVTKDSIQNNQSVCNIYVNGELRLKAIFIIDKNISRTKGKISFLVKLKNSSDIIEKVFDAPEPISFLIIPDKSFQRNFRIFNQNNKKHYILISNESKDLIYKFNKSYSKTFIKNILYNIIRDLNVSNIIFFDSNNDWSDQNLYNLIEYELKRNKISLFQTKYFSDLTELDEDLSSYLLDDIFKMSLDEKKVYIITPAQYLKVSNIFPSIRKNGFKVVDITEVI